MIARPSRRGRPRPRARLKRSMPTLRAGAVALLAVQALVASPAVAQSALSGETIRMSRAAGPITIDGRLGDEGWRGAVRVVRWYETNPGDNTEPPVGNVGYLTFDDRYFYAGFEFEDRIPRASARPTPIATTSATASTTTAASSSTLATPAARPPSSSSRRTTRSTTRSRTIRRARTRRPTSSGSRRPRSPTTGGRRRSRFRSARCAIPRPIRRRGASCSIATTRASTGISSSRRSCRAAATASSADRTCSSASSGCRPAGIWSPRRT